jgi:hypothetical protein
VSCGPLPGEASAPLRAFSGDRAVIEGVVVRDGELVRGAYVRLLDSHGEFVAEVQTDWAGRFRFYAAGGDWTLRTMAPGTPMPDQTVTLRSGEVLPVEVELETW